MRSPFSLMHGASRPNWKETHPEGIPLYEFESPSPISFPKNIIEIRYSFDHALNPRLAKKLIQVFCAQIVKKNSKHVFLTTHNPLVLDGLDISNDDIRLFAVDRDKNGYVQIKRIKVSQELVNEGQPLSRLWINGRLGGVPDLL